MEYEEMKDDLMVAKVMNGNMVEICLNQTSKKVKELYNFVPNCKHHINYCYQIQV